MFDDDQLRRKLRSLRITGFAEIFFKLTQDEDYTEALPEDIFIAAVDEAVMLQDQRKIAAAISHAQFPYPEANVDGLQHVEARGISMRSMQRLVQANWREIDYNLHLFAPTGAGKTYIACVLGVAACHNGHKVAYWRTNRLCNELAALPKDSAEYNQLCRKLINVDLLILDDFLTVSIDQRGQEDLTEIIIERSERLSTIVCSQTAAPYWLEALPNKVGADSLVNRLSQGQRLSIGDMDMRQVITALRVRENPLVD